MDDEVECPYCECVQYSAAAGNDIAAIWETTDLREITVKCDECGKTFNIEISRTFFVTEREQ